MAKRLPASKVILGLAGVMTLWSGVALANDDLAKQQQDPKQWVMPLGNYAGQRYSGLDQINNKNVKNLQVAWTFSTGVLRGSRGWSAGGRQHDVCPCAVPQHGLRA
jgi:alcohol dehydrogenase (cytochrome c)